MSDILIKCSICGAVLDEEDLFCPNCGTEAPPSGAESNQQTPGNGPQATGEGQEASDKGPATTAAAPSTHLTTCNFSCRSCGASMSYDASAQTLRCPFCGSQQLEKKPDAKEIAPDGVVPFVV